MKNIYASSGSITPTQGNQIATIDFIDRMTVIMDITIMSFPSNSWRSIFQIGGSSGNKYPRSPGIWLYNNVDGFHTCITNTNKQNDCNNIQVSGNLQENIKYTFKMEISQSSLIISVNNVIIHEDYSYPTHLLITNANVYAGHPDYNGANVMIENLRIQIPASICCGYSAIYPSSIVGHEFKYEGEYNNHAYYHSTSTGNYQDYIFYHNGYKWYNALAPTTGYSRASDEVDSLYGAQWNAPILLSATVCGVNDPNTQQSLPIIPIIHTIHIILILSILISILWLIYNIKIYTLCTYNNVKQIY